MEKELIKRDLISRLELLNEQQLSSVLHCVKSIERQPSNVWDRLSEESLSAVYHTYEESLSADNLISEPDFNALSKSWREASNGTKEQ